MFCHLSEAVEVQGTFVFPEAGLRCSCQFQCASWAGFSTAAEVGHSGARRCGPAQTFCSRSDLELDHIPVCFLQAGQAERCVVISGVVSEPDPLTAAGAESGFILQTLRADEPVVEWDELIRVVNFTAELAGDFVFFHGIVLLKLP